MTDRPAAALGRGGQICRLLPGTGITLADAVELTVGLSLVFDPLLIVRE